MEILHAWYDEYIIIIYYQYKDIGHLKASKNILQDVPSR